MNSKSVAVDDFPMYPVFVSHTFLNSFMMIWNFPPPLQRLNSP